MLPMLRKYFLESMQRTVCLSENHLVYHSNDNHISILHDDPNVTLSDFSFFFKISTSTDMDVSVFFSKNPLRLSYWPSLTSGVSHEERSCVYHLTLFHSFSRPNFQVSSHKLFRPAVHHWSLRLVANSIVGSTRPCQYRTVHKHKRTTNRQLNSCPLLLLACSTSFAPKNMDAHQKQQ